MVVFSSSFRRVSRTFASGLVAGNRFAFPVVIAAVEACESARIADPNLKELRKNRGLAA